SFPSDVERYTPRLGDLSARPRKGCADGGANSRRTTLGVSRRGPRWHQGVPLLEKENLMRVTACAIGVSIFVFGCSGSPQEESAQSSQRVTSLSGVTLGTR